MNRTLRRTVGVLLAASAIGAGALPAKAGFVTSAGLLDPGSTVIDFSQFSGPFQYTAGPVQVGGLVGEDVTWRSASPISVIGNGSYGLDPNGTWDSGRMGYVGTNDASTSARMTFRFQGGAVSQVGGFVNYAPGVGTGFLIEALDADGVVLESYDVRALAPISTPGGVNAGEFRGIVRVGNDIAAFRLSGSYALLDDLTFHRATLSANPAPPSAVLLAVGLVTLGGFRLLRRKTGAAAVA